MVALQIRGVSEPTRRTLSTEARARGESLQEYLLDREARDIDSRRLLAEWTAGPSTDGPQPISFVELIRSERDPQASSLSSKTGLTHFAAATHTLHPVQGARKPG